MLGLTTNLCKVVVVVSYYITRFASIDDVLLSLSNLFEIMNENYKDFLAHGYHNILYVLPFLC